MWRSCEGYPHYEVSDGGEVRRGGRVLRQIRHPHGYRAVAPSVNGKQEKVLVHRLVARAFLGEPPEGMAVNHLNGDKTDNRAANLEWCSYSDNMRHAWDTGLFNREQMSGENHWRRRDPSRWGRLKAAKT